MTMSPELYFEPYMLKFSTSPLEIATLKAEVMLGLSQKGSHIDTTVAPCFLLHCPKLRVCLILEKFWNDIAYQVITIMLHLLTFYNDFGYLISNFFYVPLYIQLVSCHPPSVYFLKIFPAPCSY